MPPEAMQHVEAREKGEVISVKPIDGIKWDVYSCGMCVYFMYLDGVDPYEKYAGNCLLARLFVRVPVLVESGPPFGKMLPRQCKYITHLHVTKFLTWSPYE
jgi:hypothetical protein